MLECSVSECHRTLGPWLTVWLAQGMSLSHRLYWWLHPHQGRMLLEPLGKSCCALEAPGCRAVCVHFTHPGVTGLGQERSSCHRRTSLGHASHSPTGWWISDQPGLLPEDIHQHRVWLHFELICCWPWGDGVTGLLLLLHGWDITRMPVEDGGMIWRAGPPWTCSLKFVMFLLVSVFLWIVFNMIR